MLLQTVLKQWLKNGQTPASFYFILSFPSTAKKNSVASGIQTRINREEGKDADHFATTIAFQTVALSLIDLVLTVALKGRPGTTGVA